jgi:hypothetical protein
MKVSDFNNSPYYTAADFDDKPQTWIIAKIVSERVGRDDPREKPVLDLIDGDGKPAPKRLSLNKTNLNALGRVYGEDLEGWIGRTIHIQRIWTSYMGDRVRGIGVTAPAVALRATGSGGGAAGRATVTAARRTDPASDLDDAIPF